MKDNNAMTIRQMCDTFDVTARTLRFYETKRLLSPIREGQKRLFTKRDRVRLKLIMRGKRFGLSLEKISQILALYDMNDQGQQQLLQSLEVAKERFVELTAQRDDLGIALEELSTLMKLGEEELQSKKYRSNAA